MDGWMDGLMDGWVSGEHTFSMFSAILSLP